MSKTYRPRSVSSLLMRLRAIVCVLGGVWYLDAAGARIFSQGLVLFLLGQGGAGG